MFRWGWRIRSHDTSFLSHENSTRCFRVFLLVSPPFSPRRRLHRSISAAQDGGEDTEHIRNYYPPRELAQELGWSVKTIYQLAKMEGLPIHRAPGKERGAFIIRTEFDEWANKMGYMEGEK